MIINTRPAAVAYICTQALTTRSELPGVQDAIAEVASAAGLVLLATYVEESCTMPVAFGEMISTVWRDGVSTVILPSVVHLATLGNPVELKVHLEYHVGGNIMFLNPARKELKVGR